MTDRDTMRQKLRIRPEDIAAASDFLASPDNRLMDGLFDVIDKYGGVDTINRDADAAGRLETRLARLRDERSPFLSGLDWLVEQRDAGAFVTLPEYRRSVLGVAADRALDEHNAVTLEISALQYFPWLIDEACQAIERRELMPARYIRVRNMAEQTAPRRGHPRGGGGDADHRRDPRGDPRYARHRRQQRPPRRSGDDHRLLRRHRSAQRLPAEVGRRVTRCPYQVRHPPGAQREQRDHPDLAPDAPARHRERVQGLGVHGRR